MSRLEKLQEFLALSPNDPFNLYAIAHEYVSQGQDAKAEPYFEKLLADHPAYTATYYHYGKLLERAAQPDKAAQQYRNGIDAALAEKNRHAARELRDALAQLTGDDEDDF